MKKLFAAIISVVMVFALAVPAFAATSSPTQGVEIKSVVGYDVNGEEETISSNVEIVATPYALKEEAPAQEVKDILNATGAIVLKDIPAATTALNEVKADPEYADLELDDMAIDYYVDLSFIKDGNTYQSMDDLGLASTTVTMASSYKPGDAVLVLVNCDGTKWEAISQNNITIASDGTLTIKFDKFCAVVIAGESNPDGQGTSPQTGDVSTSVLAASFVAVALIATVGSCLVVDKRRK